jgi:glycosyltransferase involved in cell wall biosynthesis
VSDSSSSPTLTTKNRTASAPVRVAIIDIKDPIPDVDCRHPVAEYYRGLWVLAVRDDSPIGLVDVPVSGPVLRSSDLADHLRDQLDEQWNRPSRIIRSDRPLPSIAVVVPTNLGRPTQLRSCVQSLTQLDYPDFEIVVVDNRTGAAPPHEVLESMAGWPRVRVVCERRPGISAARNRGIEATTADVVAFTDDDVRVHPRWLWALGHRFASDPELDAVTGLVLPDELETDAQLLFEQSGSGQDRGFRPVTFRLADQSGPRWRQLLSVPMIERHEPGTPVTAFPLYATGELGIGSNMAFRTDALRTVGGFDVALGVGTATCGGEDLAMLLELLLAGRSLGYEPSAIVHHTHRRTIKDLEIQLRGYGVGFSAMVFSLVLRDFRRLRGFAVALPRGLRAMLNPDSTKRSGRNDDYPKQLSRAELRGMLTGPGAYLRERWSGRTWGG